ncbi:MAG: hypothetical protein QQN63_00510 [Nitrosopumilus sp.]
MKITVGSVLAGLAIVGAVAGGWVAIGGRIDTPAEVSGEHVREFHDHVETFEGHVAHIDTFLAQYEAAEVVKAVSRAQRTLMVEAQTKITCLTIGADTLAMLSLISICDDLGVPVN